MKENKLIAEFMGMTQGRPNKIRWKHHWFDDKGAVNGLRNTHLRFHSSWDWLMPVVEKIDKIGASVLIGRMFCQIEYLDPLDKLKPFGVRIASGVKINAVFGAVVDFIKWYNEQNKA